MTTINIKRARVLIILAIVLVISLLSLFFSLRIFARQDVLLSGNDINPSYRSMSLSWDSYESTDTTTTTIYAVYRADDSTGKNAQRIAILDSTTKKYKDIYLIPGKSYSYAVICSQGVNGADGIDTSNLKWSALYTVPLIGGTDSNGSVLPSPHVGADTTGAARNQKGCNKCHVVHDAAKSSKNLIVTNQGVTELNASIALCESCHMSNSAIEKDVIPASLVQTEGHTIKNINNINGLFECSTCHGVHQDSSGAKGALLPTTIKKFGSLDNDIEVNPSANNAQCVSCHDDQKTWYTATHSDSDGYPSLSSPTTLTASVDSGLNGYPLVGTFPGESVVESSTLNAHARIEAYDTYDRGDCRFCHSSHANGAKSQLNTDRGELRAMEATGGVVSDEEKTSGAYASFCLSCHNGSNKGTPWAAAKDVSGEFMVLPGSTEASRTAFLKSNAGHRISSGNGDLPAGSSLPCYACHNPHGSATNAYSFSDVLGTNLKSNNDFCFTCHVSSDGFVCEDGNQRTTVVFTPETKRQTVYGISRSSGKLKLIDVSGDAHKSTSTQSCASCHGTAHSPVVPTAGL